MSCDPGPAGSRPSSSRLIAIGDMHGCATALVTLLDALQLTVNDTLVTLGDYVDRGPESPRVLDTLIALAGQCRLIPLRGNHEELMLAACKAPDAYESSFWLSAGGRATLDAYGGSFSDIPQAHLNWLRATHLYFETQSHVFVHASYLPEVPWHLQPLYQLQWSSFRDGLPEPHFSGKTVVVGHTSQRSGEVFNAGHLICIDTFCHGGGWLTALDVVSGTIWQANQMGRLRTPPASLQ